MSSIRATIPLAMLLLSGCVVGPDHKAPETQMPGKFAEGGTATNGDVATVAWWNAFNDSRLNGYVATGLSQNLTVLQALERINQAQSQITVAGAGALPSLTGSASHATGQTTGSFPSNNSSVQNKSTGGLDVSWLLDLFGQYRRSKENASAQLDAAYSTADVQRLTLISSVVSAYIDVRYYQERLAIARENLKSRRETLDLTKLQLEAGAASRLDVVQSEGLVNSTLADMPGLETSFRQAAHRIATLLGMPASSLVVELQRGARQPVARRPATTGIPADLIRNRPDIRVAERNLAAATAQIGVAESRLYPSITISGSISPSYVNLSNNGSRGTSNTWSFGPSLVLPILDGGSLRANVDIAKSSAREQYLVWKSTVLNAIEEVENALAAVNRDKQTEDALRRTVKSYQEALSLATASYRDGASSLLDVLDAQRQVSTAQANLATAVQKTAQDYVSLSIALGGGYAVGETQAVTGPKVAAANTPKGM
ncbi:efflux transporter outer membrane subunit [Agrobacterium sp. fls2-241-TYG-188a]|uniref:efflux transporter outer membrane subunit n=1 Tax=Agrobacterium sp. fls2-241-TYG-188a TaxID=3040275 RepID=UPI00254C0E9C|nr:efflux transporter outer membrane subunit [Agrobacterium sp. fls2-241-TYG-188a]